MTTNMRRLFVAILTLTSGVSLAETDSVAAKLGDRIISLSEVDRGGGSSLHDAAKVLYEARVRSLYRILGDHALAVEAKRRNVTIGTLTEQEVIDKTPKVTEADINELMQSKGLDTQDAQLRSRVAMALASERANKRRNEYLATLFKEQGLTVSLPGVGEPPREEIRGASNSIKGSADAPVSIVVFSDFQCPYCRQMAGTLAQAAQMFPNDIRIEHRALPLQADSQTLAEAALCAEDQGKFWEYHDAIFREARVSATQVDQLANDIALDMTAFRRCIDSGAHRGRLMADKAEATRLGVNATPTIFINGVRLRGAVALPKLAAEIRNAMARVAESAPRAKRPGA